MKENICDKIENDEFFQNFLRDGASSQTAEASRFFSYTEQINKLAEGLDALSTELQSQVREQHGALLSQASHAGKLDGTLAVVHGHMESLVGAAGRLKSHVNTPYDVLESRTRVLGRLHETTHILRQAGIFLQLYKRLLATKEFERQATIFHEIDSLIEDDVLNSVQFLKEEITHVQSNRRKLITLADKELNTALKNLNVDTVQRSLQIFSNLQILRRYIDDLLETFIGDIRQSIKECFTAPETKLPGAREAEPKGAKAAMRAPGKAPALTTSLHFRAKLWNALEWLFAEEIFSFSAQIRFLQKCVRNSGLMDADMEIEGQWWRGLQELLKTSFSACPPHIGQCLQQGLPKLVAETKSLFTKLQIESPFREDIYQSLETGFLEKCASNLKAAIAATDLPSEDTLDALIRAAATELGTAIVDQRLCDMVTSVVMSCNRDVWNRLESSIKLGTDSKQIVDIPNSAQIQNTSIANLISYHAEAVKRLVDNLGATFASSGSAKRLLDNLNIGQNLVLAILQQIFDSIASAVHDIMISMHREPALNVSTSSSVSLYMKELQEFLSRVWGAHIAPFADRDTVAKCGRELASRCIELFIRNVAILRPLSQIGRNKIRIDCQHLEVVLVAIVGDLATLGKPFRAIRAFNTILTLTPKQLSEHSMDPDNPIPSYIVLLMMFSFAGTDLTSPNVTAGWSNEKLMQWLDGHTSNRERLELISGALHKYRNTVRQKNITQYDPVYPLIASGLEKAQQSL
ncbi:conserved oligomeric Golgi complex subunit 5-like [Phlebotomus argentipes]|uniref:conserved oligomeric Golgi complex subunit 5-like n=1 Tax=Phlebotomus argentipes TaxID=94469 RepID=UPI002892B3B4|nr:conserved oligomeric Golgi complex subunit 5-like [Phlebotomus argentipes]